MLTLVCTKSAARGGGFAAVQDLPLNRQLTKRPHANVHDDAERQEGKQDGTAAIAQQWEGDAGDGHEAEDHADVDGDLENDDGDHAHDDKGAGQVGGCLGILDEAHEDEEIEEQDAERADEAVLLAECGEDEVGVGDGEEIALGLGTLVGALAPDAAGADGNEGLSNLVAGSPWDRRSGLMKLVMRAFW